MNCSFLRHIGLVLVVGIFSFATYAESTAAPSSESFQTTCTNAWMKNAADVKDPVDYKNFGEKYCGCAAKEPLDNDAAVQKAVQLCMSRTLIHDAMDSMEDEVGLSKAKDSDIMEYCQDRWNLLYPKQTDEDKKLIAAHCECAKPKIVELIKQSDKMTDKQYDEGLDAVAAACSIDAVAHKPS
ncbi:MAG: hypothetical protein P4L65_10870 [Legionella sp.]|nr:hypothetical protein [Legionella sp.]